MNQLVKYFRTYTKLLQFIKMYMIYISVLQNAAELDGNKYKYKRGLISHLKYGCGLPAQFLVSILLQTFYQEGQYGGPSSNLSFCKLKN